MLTILLADDHALFREGMRHVLNDLDSDVRLLEAADFNEAVNCAANHNNIDLVLLDLNMPGKDGFSLLEHFSTHFPALPVVILSASTYQKDMQRSLDLGAMGFITKDSTADVMLNALKLVMAGGIYIPASLIRSHDNSDERTQKFNFTRRQLDVLSYMVEGLSNKEIGQALNLSEATIKMHVSAILKLMNVKNRTTAIRAINNMEIDLPPMDDSSG